MQMPHISFLHTTNNIKANKTKPKKGTRMMLGDIGTLPTQITLQKERLNTKLHVSKMMVATTLRVTPWRTFKKK